MLRYVAPAGAPISIADLARWGRVAAASPDAEDALRRDLCARFGVRSAFFTSTGRAGLTVLLRALRRLAPPGCDEVVLPSYTCYSVASSVVKAGLRLRLVDISADTLGFDPQCLAAADFSRVVAMVATNLYGLPNDMPALSQLARARGVFLVDDAAQAMGASTGGRASGTWGDAGLFSFDKGKNVTAIDGGVVVTSAEPIAAAMRDEMAAMPPATTSAVDIVKAVAYSVLLHPVAYGIPQRMPQLGLGTTVFTTAYPLHRADRALLALAVTMMPKLEDFTRQRIAHATRLLDGLASIAGIKTITPASGSRPVYLRLPVLFDTGATRDAAIAALNAAGIGATGSYPRSLMDVPELGPVWASPPVGTVGRDVAQRIATLPTHPYVTDADIEVTLATLRRLLGADAGPSKSAGAPVGGVN